MQRSAALISSNNSFPRTQQSLPTNERRLSSETLNNVLLLGQAFRWEHRWEPSASLHGPASCCFPGRTSSSGHQPLLSAPSCTEHPALTAEPCGAPPCRQPLGIGRGFSERPHPFLPPSLQNVAGAQLRAKDSRFLAEPCVLLARLLLGQDLAFFFPGLGKAHAAEVVAITSFP